MVFRFILFGVCFLGLWINVQAAHTDTKVNEAASRATIHGQSLQLQLNVENPEATTPPVIVQIQLLTADQEKFAEVKTQAQLVSGTSWIQSDIPLPFDIHQGENLEKLLWSRVHYRITNQAPLTNNIVASGIFAVSLVAQDVFRLQILPPFQVLEWNDFQPKILAIHPTTLKPVAEVRLLIEVYLQDELQFQTAGITSENGILEPVFNFPPGIKPTDCLKVRVTGSLGTLTQTTETSVQLTSSSLIILTTDKTQYMPGETVQVQWFAISDQQKALGNQKWTATLKYDRKAIVEKEIIADSDGRGRFDWPIPETISPGNFSLRITGFSAEAHARRSRMPDLSKFVSFKIKPVPKFLIKIQPDRSLYQLKDHIARIHLSVYQPDGKPLRGATVLLTWGLNQSEVIWNYSLQDWVNQPQQALKATTNQHGRCQIQVPLQPVWNIYRSVLYSGSQLTVYVTDPTTLHTERKHCKIYFREQKINIDIIGDLYRNIEGQPLEFTILTTYQDGSPAQCKVDLFQDVDYNNAGMPDFHQMSVQTSQYGLKRVRLALEHMPHQPHFRIKLRAVDRAGNSGQAEKWFNFPTEPVLHLSTNRSLFQAGQPLEVTLRSNHPSLVVWVTVLNTAKVLWSRQVTLINGKAQLTFPYSSDLVGKITILTDFESRDFRRAPDAQISYQNGLLFGAHHLSYFVSAFTHNLKSVVYPVAEGKRAVSSQSIRTPSHQSRQADQAHFSNDPIKTFTLFNNPEVGEDSNLTHTLELVSASHSSLGDQFPPSPSLLAGRNWLELLDLDLSTPISSDLDELAETLLFHSRERNSVPGSNTEYGKNQQAFSSQIQKQADEFLKGFYNCCQSERVPFPNDESQFHQLILQGRVDLARYVDPWGTPFRFEFHPNFLFTFFQIRVAGPDEQFETSDDLIPVRLNQYCYRLPVKEKLASLLNRIETNQPSGKVSAEQPESVTKQITKLVQSIRDPWGTALRGVFEWEHTHTTLNVISAGPNRKFEQPGDAETDDFIVWQQRKLYFFQFQTELSQVLQQYLQKTGYLPMTQSEFDRALEQSGKSLKNWVDPINQRPYRVQFAFRDPAEPERDRWLPIRSNKQLNQFRNQSQDGAHFQIELVSNGRDKIPRTTDDFQVFSNSEGGLASLVRSQFQHPAEFKNRIYGQILNQEGTPLAGILVAARQNSERQTEVRSNVQGKFQFPPLEPGVYTVQVASLSQSPLEMSCRVHEDEAAFLQVRLTEPTNDTNNPVLPLQSSLSGTFTDQTTGFPIPGVFVQVTSINEQLTFVTTSQKNGRYSFPTIPPGRYRVTTKNQNFHSWYISSLLIKPSSSTQVNHAFTPEPNAVRIPEHEEILQLVKLRQGSGSLCGKMCDQRQKPVLEAVVTATDVKTRFTFTTQTNQSGEFVFQQLPVGEYEVELLFKPYGWLEVVGVWIHSGQKVELTSEYLFLQQKINPFEPIGSRFSNHSDCKWTETMTINQIRPKTIHTWVDQVRNWHQLEVEILMDGGVRWGVR